jgi:HprK-related kinase A
VALILPAPPGSGKSTLCAGLVWRGWRLLSDELTLIDPATGHITPVPRPVSLKNASIDVIRQFAPQARFGPVVHETLKGSVAHFSPPPGAVERSKDAALPGWVVLPKFVAGADTRLTPLSRGKALMALADNAFNYHLHGARGFHTLADLVGRSECFEFSYSRLEEATALFAALADARPCPQPAGTS